MVVAVTIVTVGCSGVDSVPDDGETDEAYLELDVEPSSADIYLDGEYHGTVDGWHRQTVPVEPGDHRLELRADGYITQRLDVEVQQGRWVTVRTRLEPEIGTPDGGPDESDDDASNDDDQFLEPPDHLSAPDE